MDRKCVYIPYDTEQNYQFEIKIIGWNVWRLQVGTAKENHIGHVKL